MSNSLLLKSLTNWYSKSARVLPWRELEDLRDPYRILVSEIMLQQTTVATVKVRYNQFLQRFPNTKVLSEANVDEVLAQWQGLGYYNRARNLQSAAREIEEKYDGAFPHDFEKVLLLPGVGRYTAGAICSLAFEQVVPVLDVNVARVLSRVFVIEEETKSTFAQQRLWKLATQLVEESALNNIPPSTCNSALIELGAVVCTKRIPLCSQCPIQKHCGAFAANLQHQLPRTPPSKQSISRHDICLFISKTEDNHIKVLLHRCGDDKKDQKKSGNWWHGMWELPRVQIASHQTAEDAALLLLQGELGIDGVINKRIKSMRHTVTHHKITLDCFDVHIPEKDDFYEIDNTLKSTFSWHSAEDIETLALPSVMRKLLDALFAKTKDGGLLEMMK
ncbi:MAG: A/G-specific adenine glycosylase [Abditibacteriaceae bacterium]